MLGTITQFMRHLRNGRHTTCLVSAIHDAALRSVAPALHGRLLDIGCGRKPYRDLVAPYVTEHVGFDQRECRHAADDIDLFGSAYAIPADDGAFDSVLCTAVLEHLEEPEQALRECRRVLGKDGRCVYTVPFIWHVHEEPRDFYRFSRFALEHLFEKTGFEILELRALSGFWTTFGQLLVYNLDRLSQRRPLRWLRWTRVMTLVGLVVQVLAGTLDALDRAERWTCMYLVVARPREDQAEEPLAA